MDDRELAQRLDNIQETLNTLLEAITEEIPEEELNNKGKIIRKEQDE